MENTKLSGTFIKNIQPGKRAEIVQKTINDPAN